MQVNGDRLRCDPQLPSGGSRVQIQKHSQGHHLALSAGQIAQRRQQCLVKRLRQPGRPVGLPCAPINAPTPPPPPRPMGIHRDAYDPRFWVWMRPESRPSIERPGHRLGQGVLGGVLICDRRQHRPETRVLRLPIEIFEARRLHLVSPVHPNNAPRPESAYSIIAHPRGEGRCGVVGRIGCARFLLVDGSEVEFAWAAFDEQQLAELRNAPENVMPGRWCPIVELRD